MPYRSVLVASLAVWILQAATIHATTVESLDFSELHRRASTIVRARCIDRTEILDDGPVPYTRYTFEVVEAIKGCRDDRGAPLERITVRHGGTRSVHRRSDGLYVLPLRLGIPEYEPGDELVLFLTRESRLGLCAPVGLGQGAFRIRGAAGKERVANAYRNRGLFPSPEPSEVAPGDGTLDLKDFLQRCRRASAQASEEAGAIQYGAPSSTQAQEDPPTTPPRASGGDSPPRPVYRSSPSESEEPEPSKDSRGDPSPQRQVQRRSSQEVAR